MLIIIEALKLLLMLSGTLIIVIVGTSAKVIGIAALIVGFWYFWKYFWNPEKLNEELSP